MKIFNYKTICRDVFVVVCSDDTEPDMCIACFEDENDANTMRDGLESIPGSNALFTIEKVTMYQSSSEVDSIIASGDMTAIEKEKVCDDGQRKNEEPGPARDGTALKGPQ